MVQVSKKFFFTDDLEIFGPSAACDNVGDNTLSEIVVTMPLVVQLTVQVKLWNVHELLIGVRVKQVVLKHCLQ